MTIIATFPYDSSDDEMDNEIGPVIGCTEGQNDPIVLETRKNSFRVETSKNFAPTVEKGSTMEQFHDIADIVGKSDKDMSNDIIEASGDINAGSTVAETTTPEESFQQWTSPTHKSSWRQRRDRRRGIYAILIVLGTLIVVVSIIVGYGTFASKSDSDSETYHPDDEFNSNSSSSHTTSPQVVALEANQFLEQGDFVYSPSGVYYLGLDNTGDFILNDKSSSRRIWSAGTNGATRVFLQSDGNLIVKSKQNQALWSSRTYGNRGATLVLNDSGRIAILNEGHAVWFEGIPQRLHYDSPSNSLSFPTRGIFYYPWFPETWTVNDKPVKFEPTLGLYSSSNPDVARAHIDAMDYAHIDLSIASWWGPETNLDRARLTMLMDETIQMNSTLKWSVYHEQERVSRPSADALRRDLEYLEKWFTWHPTWGRVDGRPVIFVYNEPGCEVAQRWMEASNGEWYVILKLFSKFLECPQQPDAWHQYGVNGGEPLAHDSFSITIAPGFWRADQVSPMVPRVSREQWCENAAQMAKSEIPWHLIISFNEAGEGTNIESSPHWASDTPYGYYLDCLHEYPTTRGTGKE